MAEFLTTAGCFEKFTELLTPLIPNNQPLDDDAQGMHVNALLRRSVSKHYFSNVGRVTDKKYRSRLYLAVLEKCGPGKLGELDHEAEDCEKIRADEINFVIELRKHTPPNRSLQIITTLTLQKQ
ncbi:hypothetical protein AJ80_02887 [Polytolypa hystricis UAMH7299]|uniref:Uncharacterized protein n=1 Tax=Polytolypa hystricis (strain UAMH7299) TaxID=1447883 RepID=A0A2B7YQ30_POLH7|nr:hypothetical protein AJ80_02887 [Polytolypa hystricis UAMH7299]